MHVDPVRPVLTALGSILLKLRCDGPLSNAAFNFNLRRYTVVAVPISFVSEHIETLEEIDMEYQVWRCRLSLSQPH